MITVVSLLSSQLIYRLLNTFHQHIYVIILSPRFDDIIHLFCLYWDLNTGLSWSILTSLTADHILQCNQRLPLLNQHSTAVGTSNIINTPTIFYLFSEGETWKWLHKYVGASFKFSGSEMRKRRIFQQSFDCTFSFIGR